jgi:hypothetical protein
MGRPAGSRNKRTIERERRARAIAAGTADADVPRAVEVMRKIMKHWLDKADAELAKPEGERDAAIVAAALGEARTSAQGLALYESPRLTAVAVGQVTKKIVEVIGGLLPRKVGPPPPPAPMIALVPKADTA